MTEQVADVAATSEPGKNHPITNKQKFALMEHAIQILSESVSKLALCASYMAKEMEKFSQRLDKLDGGAQEVEPVAEKPDVSWEVGDYGGI